jgi:delta1-piperideine-2-carboxylate reductase
MDICFQTGVGLGENGEPSNDPKEVLKGVLLPFGGYKGSAISMMVELFAAGLTGDVFSYEAQENDNNDGGPPSGGEFIMALNPEIIGDLTGKNIVKIFSKVIVN